MTPPTLPGEVWRGDIDGPVCVTEKRGNTRAWRRWWGDSQWVREHDDWAERIFIAWALSLRAERDRNADEVAYLRRREKSMIEAVDPADGGQYRADIVSAFQRVKRERDAAQRLAAAERAYRVAMDAHRSALERDASVHVIVNMGVRLDEARAALIAAGGTP